MKVSFKKTPVNKRNYQTFLNTGAEHYKPKLIPDITSIEIYQLLYFTY